MMIMFITSNGKLSKFEKHFQLVGTSYWDTFYREEFSLKDCEQPVIESWI
jgi:hypothetical protein